MSCADRAIIRNDLAIYDQAAPRWWSDQPDWVRALEKMVPARLAYFDRLIDWTGKEVLDLGCAGGVMAEALAHRGAVVTGIDPAAQAVAAARCHAAEHGLTIRYDVGAGEQLPYADDTFDAIVCVDVLEHVDDLDRVVKESARVLRPGGLLLFDTINRTLLARLVVIKAAEDWLGLLPRGTHDSRRFIRPREIREILARHALTPGTFTGLGPRWVDRKDDITFGRLPFRGILFMGSASKP